MQRRVIERERGTAFILTLILTFLLAGAVGLLLLASATQSRNSIEGETHAERLLLSDNGLAKAKSLIFNDPNSFKTKTTGSDTGPTFTVGDNTANGECEIAEDDTTVWVLALSDTSSAGIFGPWLYQVTSIATVNNSERTTRMIIEFDRQPGIAAGAGLGAVVAQGTVDLSGNIDVDGNDHSRNGLLLASGAGDRPGVVTTNNVVLGGSSAVGGNGNSLSGSATAPTYFEETTSAWNSEADTTNGVDDDADGIIDDDFGGNFPGTNPAATAASPEKGAAAFLDWPTGVTEAQLWAAATGMGTGFTSWAAYEAWVASTPPEDQGGKIVYVRFADPADGGPAAPHTAAISCSLPYNEALSATDETRRPTVFVVGRAPNSATGIISHDIIIKNLHPGGYNNPVTGLVEKGGFQGLAVIDSLDKVNSGTEVVGSLVAYKAGSTHLFGNGNSDILFSSDVMSRLPSADLALSSVTTEILAWWED